MSNVNKSAVMCTGRSFGWFCCGTKTYDTALRGAWSYAFWKIFGVNENVACDVQLFTAIRTLEDALKSRRVQFRRKLSYTGNDVIIIIIRKFITRTCSQALSMNRRRGQSLGGLTVCINC